MGVELGPDDVAYRCNLVTLSADAPPLMVDFAAGHPTNAQSHPIVAALDAELGNGRDGVRFHPGVEYRHLCVVPKHWADADCTPPHDLTGRVAVFPSGPAAPELRALMDVSRDVVGRVAGEVGSEATQIWLWGQGVRPALPSFTATYGVAGRMSSAVDLVQGLGVLTGIDVVDVPGASCRVRQRLRRAGPRVHRLARRSRAVRAACGSDRRSRAPGPRRCEGRRPRAMGPRDHRSDRRRARPRAASRTGSCCCRITRRRARSRRTRRTRCRTCCSTRPSTGPAATTPKPGRNHATRCRRTS